ncbi:MAG: hypothetical protein CMJ46_09855 [Planctomyces sp.]|nr:hypothetical protein [Planctomyces sp.]
MRKMDQRDVWDSETGPVTTNRASPNFGGESHGQGVSSGDDAPNTAPLESADRESGRLHVFEKTEFRERLYRRAESDSKSLSG